MSTVKAHLPWGLCPPVPQDSYQWMRSHAHLNGVMRFTWRVKRWTINLHGLRVFLAGLWENATVSTPYFHLGKVWSNAGGGGPVVTTNEYEDEKDVLCNWRASSHYDQTTNTLLQIIIGEDGEALDASGVLESEFYVNVNARGTGSAITTNAPFYEVPGAQDTAASGINIRLFHGTEDDYTETPLYVISTGLGNFDPWMTDTGYISLTASEFHPWDTNGPAIYSPSGGALLSPFRPDNDGRINAFIASATATPP